VVRKLSHLAAPDGLSSLGLAVSPITERPMIGACFVDVKIVHPVGCSIVTPSSQAQKIGLDVR